MWSRLAANAPAALLVGVSALLLSAVAWGDALRFYPRLMAERATVLSATIADPLASYAETGLPLADFTGFTGRARAARGAAPEIDLIEVVDIEGRPLFQHPATPAAREDVFQITRPIENRFGRIGEIRMTLDQARLEARVGEQVGLLPYLAPVLALATLFVLAAFHYGDRKSRIRRSEVIAGAAFALFAGASLVAMLDLYVEGAQSKTEAFAASLAGRLGAATEIGLDPRSFSGLNEVLAAYRDEAEGVSRVEILADGSVAAEAGLAEASGWGVDATAEVTPHPGLPQFQAVVTTPVSAMLGDLWPAARNFLVLFIACAVAGYLMISMGQSMGGQTTAGQSTGDQSRTGQSLGASPITEDATYGGLTRIRALYFLGVGMDSMLVAFLPGVTTDAALAAGLPANAGAWPFAAYFIALTLALIPASAQTGRGKTRTVLLAGAVLATAGFALLAIFQDFWALMAARAIAGAGQGALLVGAQAYAMAAAPQGQRTRAAAVQVFAFNAGLLCGASIGGMMFDYGDADIVIRSALIIGLIVVFMAVRTPAQVLEAPKASTTPQKTSLAPLKAVFADRGFVLTLGLAGGLSKFILAGVVMFGAPLLLAARGWTADTVGQMLMVFAIATLIAIPLSSRLSDRSGDPGKAIVIGAIMTACGVMIFSLPLLPASIMDFPAGGLGDAACSLIGLSLLGLGQGTTAAPLIAEIAQTRVAGTQGRDATLGVYRLLERGGHILGPAAMARAGATAGSFTLLIFGLGAGGCALLYALVRPRKDRINAGTKT